MADRLLKCGSFFVRPMCVLSPMLITCTIFLFLRHVYIVGAVLLAIFLALGAAIICCNLDCSSICSEIGDQLWLPRTLRGIPPPVRVPEGLFPFEIQALPKFKFKRSTVHGSGGGGGWTQCMICLRVVKVGEMVRQLPKCSHLFHVKCIDKWLASHKTCPLCRQNLILLSLPPV